MNKKQLKKDLESMGIKVVGGKVKKSDIKKALGTENMELQVNVSGNKGDGYDAMQLRDDTLVELHNTPLKIDGKEIKLRDYDVGSDDDGGYEMYYTDIPADTDEDKVVEGLKNWAKASAKSPKAFYLYNSDIEAEVDDMAYLYITYKGVDDE